MCLLMEVKPNSEVPKSLIEGAYRKNPDGLGIMYHDGTKPVIIKELPKSADDAVAIYDKYARGRTAFVHFRMRTHGNVDIDNCHPYEVFPLEEGGLWMMHNGVLHTGNEKDTSRSDTFHFIKLWLRPLVEKAPSLAFSPLFHEMLGKFIESNRFALMDGSGRMAVVNRKQGVVWKGTWFSNTYAWDYSQFVAPPAYKQNYLPYTGWKQPTKTNLQVVTDSQFAALARNMSTKFMTQLTRAKLDVAAMDTSTLIVWDLVDAVIDRRITQKTFLACLEDAELAERTQEELMTKRVKKAKAPMTKKEAEEAFTFGE